MPGFAFREADELSGKVDVLARANREESIQLLVSDYNLSPEESAKVSAAFKAVHTANASEVHALQAGISDPVARQLIEWEWLRRGKGEAAERMIQSLSGFYRRSLAGDPSAEQALEQEVDLSKSAVVRRWFTCAPITSRRRVRKIIGTSANGMPKLSTT